MKWHRHFLLVAFVSALGSTDLAAQSLRFFAKPFDVKEGDAVIFTYLEGDSDIAYADIKAWKWDFDGNVSDVNNPNDPGWDVKRTVNPAAGVTADQITTSWSSAVFNANAGTGTTLYRQYTPKLQITRQDDMVFTVTGITEDVVGLDGAVDPFFTVRKPGAEDGLISVSFSANPRLARAQGGALPKTDAVRIYAEVSFKPGVTGAVTGYEWDVNWTGADTADPDLPGFPFAPEAQFTNSDSCVIPVDPAVPLGFYYPSPMGGRDKYSVALKVNYDLTIDGVTTSLTKTILKRDFIVVEDVPAALNMGRAYRQGFPERYGWDDIVLTYRAADGGGSTYVYFNLLEDAFFAQQQALAGDVNDPVARKFMAESVNELSQGQSMRGFQEMINALRMRYPRITGTEDPEERLPPPAGAREEAAGLERAALDFQQPIQYAAFAVRAYGASILRAGPPSGTLPPYPMFPNYITYDDSTLSGTPIPVKNEYWQVATAAGGMAQARGEKAKLLWRLSAQDETALAEAKEDCKVTATQAYLNMALLSTGQTAAEFVRNEGNNLLANVRIATDLFDKINDGINPLGNDGSYIPNESFAAIYQDAQEAIADAREAEALARSETRTFDRNQADLRNELLAQRNQYITPLKLLTGIDPAQYNNLATVGDQNDFKNAFSSRLNNLLQNYPNADPAGLGQFGAQVAAILDAQLAVQDQVIALNNLYERIKISRWANTEIDVANNQATAKLKAHDIARGYANGISLNVGYSTNQGAFAGVSINTGAIISGYLNASDRDVQRLQQAQIADIQLEAEIRKELLNVAKLSIAIRRAGNQLTQARLGLDSLRAQMDRLIEDLAHTRATAADLYFQDPSFRVFASQTERRAAAELEFSIDRLYRLAKTLEYEWTEAYQNPVLIPAASFEPPALESTLFDKFTRLDSLFVVRSADEAKDYLDALKAWDSKLRRVTGVSVRGPNNSAPLDAVPISLREDVFGYRPDPANGYSLADSIADFRNLLETLRQENYYNVLNPSMEIRFPLGIEDNSYFPATGSRWNMRVHGIGADIYAESGFSDFQVAEIDLIESGMVTLRRYWASLPQADDLMKLTQNVDNIDRTVFATAFSAKINGATANRPPDQFLSLGLKGRPVAATEWILRINTENPANRNIDFTRIKDIVLKFSYVYGNPPEFPGF